MIVGHYAAALVPYSRLRARGCPLWLLLVCANLPEFLWLALALAGVERPEPRSLWDASLGNLRVDMLYSHDLVPALLLASVVAIVIALRWPRQRIFAVYGGGLSLFHVLSDYVVGFEHHVFGPGTPSVGLNTYGSWPVLAVAIELAFATSAVWAYHRSEAARGRPVSAKRRWALYAVFIIGVLFFLPAAFAPLREVFAGR